MQSHVQNILLTNNKQHKLIHCALYSCKFKTMSI